MTKEKRQPIEDFIQDVEYGAYRYQDSDPQLHVEKYTHVIDFSQQPSYTDRMVANACVEVMTSDGSQGSLTHVRISNNTRQFAEDLRGFLGKDGIPVVLAGGDANIPESVGLVQGLYTNLARVGFVVAPRLDQYDVLGRVSRQSTLFPDHVDVKRRELKRNAPIQIRRFSFPIGK